MLYTTKEIAEMYGGEQKNVTPYMITHTWIPNGLKYIKGKGKGYLIKREWVEEYLERMFIQKQKQQNNSRINTRIKRSLNNDCFVH